MIWIAEAHVCANSRKTLSNRRFNGAWNLSNKSFAFILISPENFDEIALTSHKLLNHVDAHIVFKVITFEFCSLHKHRVYRFHCLHIHGSWFILPNLSSGCEKGRNLNSFVQQWAFNKLFLIPFSCFPLADLSATSWACDARHSTR